MRDGSSNLTLQLQFRTGMSRKAGYTCRSSVVPQLPNENPEIPRNAGLHLPQRGSGGDALGGVKVDGVSVVVVPGAAGPAVQVPVVDAQHIKHGPACGRAAQQPLRL
jgi:hypothetical protein